MIAGAVTVYAYGPISCSACAPASATREEVERAVNRSNPTGVDSPWRISGDEAFKTGEPMPAPCERSPERRHWLLEC